MSETKERLQGKIKIKIRKPIQQSLFNKFSCKLLTAFLFFIPPFLKKKKKYIDVSEQKGLPYIVNVENNTSKAVHNVELFGSYDMLNRNVFDKDGNYVHRTLKISSGIPNLSYKDMLHGFSLSKFKVGLTYIMTANQKQLFCQLRVVKKKIYGDLLEKILIVAKDPYQQQMNILVVKSDYEIDGLTKFVIPTLEPNTKVSYYFYPESMIHTEVKKQNLAYRFFNSISNFFKKKEVLPQLISKPYTIQVTNDTDEIIKDVSIFGSFINLSTSGNREFNQHNDLVSKELSIKSLTPNISYAEMLYYVMNNSLSVGLNYVRVSDGNANQIFSNLKIKTQDANGNITEKTLVLTIDPYQQQNDIVVDKEKFVIDGFTELIIEELQPKTTVVFQLYPSNY